MIPIFDAGGVVIKSDTLVDEQLKLDLRQAAAELEKIPEAEKDWHPRSDGKVLDLVHPSLWPLVYGRSRVVADGSLTLDNCLDKCGVGEVIPVPPAAEKDESRSASQYHPRKASLWSTRFQWLPCEVDIGGDTPKIVSYINNLHPTANRDLYGVVERLIAKSLPLWDQVYRWSLGIRDRSLRIVCKNVSKECTMPELCEDSDYGCDPMNRPVDEGENPRPEENEYWRLRENDPLKIKDKEWFFRTHPCDQPEPGSFYEAPKIKLEDVPTDGYFRRLANDRYIGAKEATPPRKRIQVIVKLASIHLTPEKPSYDGGAWHIEGQMNERICATALYYYDSDNITPSHLAFRTVANEEDLMMELGYEQGDMHSIGGTFAIDPNSDDTIQPIGRTATPEGRLLAFPNLYQHQVAPFKLADPTRPGHRKIIALFLVDPATPVISTAHVAPQQSSWWLGAGGIKARVNESGRLPPEIVEMVSDNLDWPVSLEEAKKARLELMDERTQMDELANSVVMDGSWNFCEH